MQTSYQPKIPPGSLLEVVFKQDTTPETARIFLKNAVFGGYIKINDPRTVELVWTGVVPVGDWSDAATRTFYIRTTGGYYALQALKELLLKRIERLEVMH